MPENSCKNGQVCVADMAAECFLFSFFFRRKNIPPYITYLAVVVCFFFGIPEFCFAYEMQEVLLLVASCSAKSCCCCCC